MNKDQQIIIGEHAQNAAWALSLPSDVALTPPDAARFLSTLGPKVKSTTLDTWRCRRSDGPAFLRRHGRISYRVGDLRAYLGLGQAQAA